MTFLFKQLALFFLLTIPTRVFDSYVRIISKLHVRLEYTSKDLLARTIDDKTKTLTHKTMSGRIVTMSLYTPNSVCSHRADDFSSKEPETLRWIETFGRQGQRILFDIGANIGVYSIYHSLLNKGKVIAFEPSFFNLKQLTKNINLNNCEHLISVVANPLSNRSSFSEFLNGNTYEGGALSAFGVDYGADGKAIISSCRTQVLGFSLDRLFELDLLRDAPTLIKIDVDGIEDLILEGSVSTLLSDACVSVLIESNNAIAEQSTKVNHILSKHGFYLDSEISDEDSLTHNDIWVRER